MSFTERLLGFDLKEQGELIKHIEINKVKPNQGFLKKLARVGNVEIGSSQLAERIAGGIQPRLSKEIIVDPLIFLWNNLPSALVYFVKDGLDFSAKWSNRANLGAEEFVAFIPTLPELLGGIKEGPDIIFAEQKLRELRKENRIKQERLEVQKILDGTTDNK